MICIIIINIIYLFDILNSSNNYKILRKISYEIRLINYNINIYIYIYIYMLFYF